MISALRSRIYGFCVASPFHQHNDWWRFPFPEKSFDYVNADLKEVRRVVLEASSWTFQDLQKFNQDPKNFTKEIVSQPSVLFLEKVM